ncbi:MAG: RNA 2',3'-cyclic phosphodiesterase [Gemmatimonadota bacterium]|nr:RNA 2',3'-cyclic phosphodiesterase [Gemmatimonadota bacterium]
MSDEARVFVAIPFPGELRGSIVRQTAELRDGHSSVRPVREEQIHLTLRFLGDTPRSGLDALGEAVCDAAADASPFELRIGGVGAFPHARKPRVLWVGVERSPWLEALRGSLEDSLERLGFERERRPFRPHVTVARVSRGRPVPDHLPDALEAAVVRATTHVTSVALFESVLDPGGARHTVLRTCRLGSMGSD